MKLLKNKIIKESFWASIAKIIAIIGGLFFVIYIPKFSTIQLYGELSLILAYISIFSMLSGTQINSAIKNEIIRHKLTNSISKAFFYEGLKLKIILFGILSSFFILTIYNLDTPVLKENLKLILLLLISMNSWGLVISVFEAIHKLFFEAILYVVEYSITIGTILYFHSTNSLNIHNLLVAFTIGYIISLILGLIILYKQFYKFDHIKFFSLRLDTLKILLKRTFFLSLTGISIILLTKIDSIMISFFKNIQDVGYYNIASDIAKNSIMLSVPIILGTIPIFFEQNQKKFILKNIYILSIINLIVCIGILLFSKVVIVKIYGKEFEPAIKALQGLALYPLFATLQAFIQEILILKDQTKQIFLFGFFSVVLDIILSYIFIKQFGIVGASYATTAAYFTWFVLSFIYLYKDLNTQKL